MESGSKLRAGLVVRWKSRMPLLKFFLPWERTRAGWVQAVEVNEWREHAWTCSQDRQDQLPRPSAVYITPSGGQDIRRQETEGV